MACFWVSEPQSIAVIICWKMLEKTLQILVKRLIVDENGSIITKLLLQISSPFEPSFGGSIGTTETSGIDEWHGSW